MERKPWQHFVAWHFISHKYEIIHGPCLSRFILKFKYKSTLYFIPMSCGFAVTSQIDKRLRRINARFIIFMCEIWETITSDELKYGEKYITKCWPAKSLWTLNYQWIFGSGVWFITCSVVCANTERCEYFVKLWMLCWSQEFIRCTRGNLFCSFLFCYTNSYLNKLSYQSSGKEWTDWFLYKSNNKKHIFLVNFKLIIIIILIFISI